MSDTLQEDIDWEAFRYVTGEMSDSESAAFERLLADDTMACEALASVVESLEALSVVAGDQHVVMRAERRVGMRLGILATAACLLLAAIALFQHIGRGFEPAVDITRLESLQAAPMVSDNLLDAWVTTFADESDEDSTTDESETGEFSLLPWSRDLTDELDSEDVPGWMMAAVLSADGIDTSDAEPMDHN